jgi:uroporphyrinogen decarboxylase
VQQGDGVIVIQKPDAGSIPAEVDHLLKDRASWEAHYKPRLQFSLERINREKLNSIPAPADRELPIILQCGSLFGRIRNWLGVTGASYLYADDEDLYTEIIDTVANLSYQTVKTYLDSGVQFDHAHFWEDICFKNGPLVIPSVFEELVGPHYKKITSLLNRHGINIVSVDCDGCIDSLLPIWLENGVNTMFPIEVGTWHASIGPWREKYGRELRGVGGMDKKVFDLDRAAVDAEIERLKPLIDLGGYIPCPDHRIGPDAKWDNVCYYAERLRAEFC